MVVKKAINSFLVSLKTKRNLQNLGIRNHKSIYFFRKKKQEGKKVPVSIVKELAFASAVRRLETFLNEIIRNYGLRYKKGWGKRNDIKGSDYWS